MEFFSHPAADQHMSCVVKCMCPFCNVYLAVEMPCKLMEMIEVNCGHCKRNSYFSPIPPMIQSILSPEYQMASHSHSHSQSSIIMSSAKSSFFNDYKRNHPMSPAVSCASYEPTSPKTPFVVKPPEKKHRLPSAYNRFMRDEIQRIKAAKPDIPHREAFSMAAKNWARSDPRGSPTVSSSSDLTVEQRPISLPIERGIGQKTESFDIFKQFDRKN